MQLDSSIVSPVMRGLITTILASCFFSVLALFMFPHIVDPMPDETVPIVSSILVGGGVWAAAIVVGVLEGIRSWRQDRGQKPDRSMISVVARGLLAAFLAACLLCLAVALFFSPIAHLVPLDKTISAETKVLIGSAVCAVAMVVGVLEGIRVWRHGRRLR